VHGVFEGEIVCVCVWACARVGYIYVRKCWLNTQICIHAEETKRDTCINKI